MPRNNDEPVEWPDEVDPDLVEVVHRVELAEELFDSLEPTTPQENQ